MTLLLRPLNTETLATYLYQYATRGSFEDGALAALLIVLAGLLPVVWLVRLTESRAGAPIGFAYILWRRLTGARRIRMTAAWAARRSISAFPHSCRLARCWRASTRSGAAGCAARARPDRGGRPRARRGCVRATPWPAAAVALLDGWAVRAEQVADAGPYAPVLLDRAPAGLGRRRRAAAAATPMPVLPPDARNVRAGRCGSAGERTAGDGVLGTGADATPGTSVARARASNCAPSMSPLLQAVGLSRV